MPRVICDLPNASENIRGVAFHPLEDGGRISDEIDEDLAEIFASIPGYSIADPDIEPAPPPESKPSPKSRQAKKAAEKDPPKPVESAPVAPADVGQDEGADEVF